MAPARHLQPSVVSDLEGAEIPCLSLAEAGYSRLPASRRTDHGVCPLSQLSGRERLLRLGFEGGSVVEGLAPGLESEVLT